MFEIVAGELRAKLGTVSAMRQVRSGHDTCAVAAGPGCGARWLRRGLAGLFTATQRRRCEGRRRVLPQCRWAAAGPGRAHQNHKHHRCGGRRRDLPRCRWAAAGPGRASRRRAERSSQRGRLAGGPPPTGTHSGRALRRPEHPWGTKQPSNHATETRGSPPGPPRVHATSSHSAQSRARALSATEQPPPRRPGPR